MASWDWLEGGAPTSKISKGEGRVIMESQCLGTGDTRLTLLRR